MYTLHVAFQLSLDYDFMSHESHVVFLLIALAVAVAVGWNSLCSHDLPCAVLPRPGGVRAWASCCLGLGRPGGVSEDPCGVPRNNPKSSGLHVGTRHGFQMDTSEGFVFLFLTGSYNK